jgi:pyruvate/2-oxoglutarate dehydrogenase complex dihydrolipoamide dehydrogenase (E3) component
MKKHATPEHTGSIDHLILADDPHDRLLVENCHPPAHINPTPSGKYNLVAIGAGAAGLVSSGGAGALGARSALVERALTGGDCLVTGCVPSKAVIRAARAVYDLRQAREFGVRFSVEPEVSFAEAMERMRRLRARISYVDSVARFGGKYNVDVFLGHAKFTGRDTLEVDGRELQFARAVLATGGRPVDPAIPGLREAGYYTNETIFTLRALPRRIVVIGGGPIGCELAQSFCRFGAQVTILNQAERILPREDADAAEIIERQFAREGIVLCNHATVLRAERRGADRVLFYARQGRETEIACDLILAAAGRVPNVEGLGLEAAGIQYSREGVIVDDYLRTTNPRIFAAGDICLKQKFTHAADASARLALQNALFFRSAKFSALAMPWVTYTDPEVAHTGMYEADARAAGYDVATLTESFEHLDRAILDGDNDGIARVHYDRKSGRLLGGTIVARHAGEMISELTLALTLGAKIGALANTIHPYPTQADVLRKLGDAYNRTRLSPAVGKIFQRWFAWMRR